MKNWFAAGLILATTMLSVPTPLLGQDDSEALRKEIADLKREVDLLTRERDLLTQELKILKTGAKESKSAPAPEGEINGIIWEIIAVSPEGKPITSPARFHALEGKVYVKGKQVGTYTDQGETATADVNGMPDNRANGRYKFQRYDPNSYRGRMINVLGKEHEVFMRKIKD